MSTRQRRRLLRRRKVAAAQARTASRSRQVAVTGTVLSTLAGAALVAGTVAEAASPVTVAQLGDLWPGKDGSDIEEMVSVGGWVYFNAEDPTHGEELWKTNGTAAGTSLVADLWSGTSGSGPEALTAVGGSVYFSAHDGTGRHLFKTDGTAAGTIKLTPAGTSSSYEIAATGSGTVFFTADDFVHGRELWKTDGTPAGTEMVTDIRTTGSYGYTYSSSPHDLTTLGGKVFFGAYRESDGSQLWVSDGTAAGTVRLTGPGTASLGDYPDALEAVGTSVFFSFEGDAQGEELWRTDGTEAGTAMVKDVDPGPNSGNAWDLTAMGNTLFFTANDGVSGEELWRSDGTAAGTVMVGDFTNPDTSYGYYYYGGFRNLTAVGGTLFFSLEDGVNGPELWSSDGTAAGSRVLTTIPGTGWQDMPNALTPAGGLLYFAASDGVHGQELWRSDGTVAGTGMAAEVRPGIGSAQIHQMAALPSGHVVFGATNGTSGNEPWVTVAAPVTPPPPPPPPSDTVVASPTVKAKGAQKQKSKVKIVLTSSAAEAVTSTANGTIKVPGLKGKIKLKSAVAQSAAGNSGKLTLTIKSKKDGNKVLAAIGKYRKASKSQQKKLGVKALVTVVISDTAGNKVTKKVTVKLV